MDAVQRHNRHWHKRQRQNGTPRRMRLRKGICIAVIGTLAAAGGYARAAPKLEEVQPELEKVQKEMKERRQRRQALEREATALREEVASLRARAIDLAAKIQTQEERLTVLEGKIEILEEEEDAVAARLQERIARLSDSLAALQRLAHRPPVALIASPRPPSETVNTALALAGVVPALESQTREIRSEIATLANLRSEIRAEEQQRRQQMAALADDRESINALMADKAAAERRLHADAREEAERVEALARKEKSLKALLAKLEEERKRAARTPGFETEGQPFSAARGNLPLPVRGEFVRRFGEKQSGELPSRGLVIKTRDSAQVVAPYDGKVVFSGPFRDYGLLLIIAHGEGYYSLLAGMARVDTVVGQRILAGEPVGEMGEAGAQGDEVGTPRLYIELRHGGEPINPMPWLAVSQRKVSG